MTAKSKRAPAWRVPFLRALARFNNVRLAAEAAGVGKTCCYAHRRTDPRFAEAWARTKLRAASRLAKNTRPRPSLPPGLTPLDDARDSGLMVYGLWKTLPPRLQRPRRDGWSAAKEEAFLRRLAETGNVVETCKTIGMSAVSLHYRRRQDARFAERWATTLEMFHDRLEERLIGATISAFEGGPTGPVDIPDTIAIPSFSDAIMLLTHYRKREAGLRRDRPRRPLTLEEVAPSILRKLAAVERLQARDTARRAKRGG